MVKKKIILFGSGGHARVIWDALEKQGIFQVSSVVDPFTKEKLFFSIPITPVIPPTITSGVIAIGDNWKRSLVANEILSQNPLFQFETVIHPSAQVGHAVKIGVGAVIMAGACLNTGAEVGNHCIINTLACIEHDCRLGDFASLGPGAVIGGNSEVGAFSTIGLGALCNHAVKIGEHTVIGSGSVVTKDMNALIVAYGNPCKKIRERKPSDTYL